MKTEQEKWDEEEAGCHVFVVLLLVLAAALLLTVRHITGVVP